MSRIFWDTNLFVYLFENRGEPTERVVSLRKRMIERNDELFTSALTLGELLVKPMEAGNEILMRRYERGDRGGRHCGAVRPSGGIRVRSRSPGPDNPASGRDPACMCLGGGRGSVHHERQTSQPKRRSRDSLHSVARGGDALTSGEPTMTARNLTSCRGRNEVIANGGASTSSRTSARGCGSQPREVPGIGVRRPLGPADHQPNSTSGSHKASCGNIRRQLRPMSWITMNWTIPA